MRILSIETTSALASIALIEDGLVLKEISWRGDDIAADLTPRLRELLPDATVGGPETRYIVASIGPGSWTGIRLGISFAKGLAVGGRREVCCVSAPDAICYGIPFPRMPVCCVISAARGEFFYSFYRGGDLTRTFLPIRKGTPEDICRRLKDRTLFVGPGAGELSDKIRSRRAVASFLFEAPRAGISGLLAHARLLRGTAGPPPEPYYGR